MVFNGGKGVGEGEASREARTTMESHATNGGEGVGEAEAAAEILMIKESTDSDGGHGVIAALNENAVGNDQRARGVGAILVACNGDGLPVGVDGILEVVHLEGGLGIRHSRQNHQQEEQGGPERPLREGV